MAGVPSERIELMRRGDTFFLSHLERLDDEGFAQPCALPDWTRAHVVAHLARNADALVNLLTWARTGVEKPMYPSAEARVHDIEVSAQQSPDALRSDVNDASARLAGAVATMPEDAWDAGVRTARGRPITAAEVPWMRIRESWVHAVDLDVGASFDEVPHAVVIDLLDEVASGLAGRDDCPAMVVDAGERSWRVGPDGDTVTVSGSAPDLLAWLIGRAPGPDGAPAPPPWL